MASDADFILNINRCFFAMSWYDFMFCKDLGKLLFASFLKKYLLAFRVYFYLFYQSQNLDLGVYNSTH